jgi:hypothetical protein
MPSTQPRIPRSVHELKAELTAPLRSFWLGNARRCHAVSHHGETARRERSPSAMGARISLETMQFAERRQPQPDACASREQAGTTARRQDPGPTQARSPAPGSRRKRT